jgi:hypothetical protein
MSIFSSLFGGKKKSPTGQPPEWIKILEKIAGVMEDENLQNSMYHPEITDKVFGGIDVDEFPHGIGEFGRSGENPIPVNGPIGELIYLSCLKTQRTNQRLLFHRLGSEGEIDIYETVSIDGQNWDILFFSMYHPRKSRKAPGGFVIVDPRTQPHLYGSNRMTFHSVYMRLLERRRRIFLAFRCLRLKFGKLKRQLNLSAPVIIRIVYDPLSKISAASSGVSRDEKRN